MVKKIARYEMYMTKYYIVKKEENRVRLKKIERCV